MIFLKSAFSSLLRLDSALPVDEVKLNPVEYLVEDTVVETFCHLDLGALNSCLRVSKKWSKSADKDRIFHEVIYRTFAFNKEKWAKYHGDVGEEPPLPADIRAKLKESHKALKGHHARIEKIPIEKVRIDPVQKLFKLLFMPATIDQKPFAAKMYGELVKQPKEGNKTGYEYFWASAMAEHGEKSPENPCWMLITKTVIEGSRAKSYSEQQALVATLPGFEIPKLLVAIAANFTEYVETGIRLYSDESWIYTSCQESTQGYQLVVGGFAPAGLWVSNGGFDDDCRGAAAFRKF